MKKDKQLAINQQIADMKLFGIKLTKAEEKYVRLCMWLLYTEGYTSGYRQGAK